MSLIDLAGQDGRAWNRIGDSYSVTKKPRDLNVREYPAIPFVPMEFVPQGGAYAPSFTLKAPDELTSGTYFERGDVLVSKITPSFENGKQAFVQALPLPFGYATTEVIPLRPTEAGMHDPRLLFFYLLHPDVRHYVAERMEGSTGRQRVPESVLLDLPMPDIESDQQAKAADALELIQAAIAVETKAAENAQELKRAAMRELFTRGLRGEAQKETEIGLVPESWEFVPLGSLGRIGNGTTPNRRHPAYWQGGTIPWITSGRMYERQIATSDTCVTRAALEECRLPLLQPGAVLIAIVGQGKTLGHCAILEVEATISRHVGFVQPKAEAISSGYLRSYLESQYEWLRQLASGNGSTRGALTGAILKTLSVPLPARDEQREIVVILDAIERKIALHRQKRALLEELFKSLLHKLMTGEIRVADLDLSALLAPLAREGTA